MQNKLSEKTRDHLKHLREIQLYIAQHPKKNLKDVMQAMNLDYQTHRGVMANNERYRTGINYAKTPRGAKRILSKVDRHHIIGKAITYAASKGLERERVSKEEEEAGKKTIKLTIVAETITTKELDKIKKAQYKKGLLDGIVIAVFLMLFGIYYATNFYYMIK